MWQRIKHFVEKRKSLFIMPLFAKMVLLYSFIVFVILLIVSVTTVTSVHYIMTKSIEQDLYTSAKSVQEYLTQTNRMDTSVFTRSNIQPFVNLQIYDQSGKLIMDNAPAHTMKNLSDRYIDDAIRSNGAIALPMSIQGNETNVFSYYKEWSDPQNGTYYLRFSRVPDKENAFISLLSKQLLASVLISLILTILSGIYLMKKSMEPLNLINKAL